MQLYNKTQMPERRAWTNQEDRILKYLKQDLQITKWSTIAKRMADEYNMVDRTGKQCRERYHNHLDSTILRTEWTPEQQQYLYKLHDEIGNKWAIIAQKLPGRTDNCVKNHFYSKMRKSIRKLNKIIYQYYKKELKQIKMTVLYKIVQATDERFKNNPSIQQEISQKCCRIYCHLCIGLKNLLLMYSNDANQMENDVERLGLMAKQIHDFSAKYRRKVKKTRRASVSGQELIMKLPKFQISQQKIKSMSDCEDQDGDEGEDDEYSNVLSHDSDYFLEEQDKCFKLGKPLEEIKEVADDLKESTKQKQQKQMSQINLLRLNPSQTISTSPTRCSLIKPPPLIKPPLIKPPLNEVEQGDKVHEFLRNKGIVEQEVESPLHHPNYPYPYNPNASVSNNNKINSLVDSCQSMEDENRNVNFLSESIEKLRIGSDIVMVHEDIDDQHKLFANF